MISVLLHFATLFAVVFTFRKHVWELIKHSLSKEAINLYIATIPTVLIVLFFKSCLSDYFESSKLLPFGFLITAILLLFTYLIVGKKNEYEKQINRKSALLMGISQGFAALPGISRSGSTICTGLLSGKKREETVRFSFIMSIPIIIASVVYELFTTDISVIANSNMVAPIILSTIIAFVVGIFSIKLMLRIIKMRNIIGFPFTYLLSL